MLSRDGNTQKGIEELKDLLTLQLRHHESIDNVNKSENLKVSSLSSLNQLNEPINTPGFEIEFPESIKYIIMNIGKDH